MSSYCTLIEARDAGAVGSDAEVQTAIESASARITRYTRELFEPTVLTLDRPIGGDGRVLTHLRIIDVTAVRYLGWATPIVSSSYRVLKSSEADGRVDSILLADTLAWADVTVLGAEPWNGGWANLMYGNVGGEPHVEIDGTFGYDETPEVVSEACAIVAAQLRGRDRTPASSGGVDRTPTDVEGNVIPVVPLSSAVDDLQQLVRSRARTTGSKRADELLAAYVREPVRIRA